MSSAAAAQRAPMANSVKAAEMLDQYDNSHPEATGSSASRKTNFSCASCAAIFSSSFLVLLNFVFFILGVIVLALGAWAQNQKVGGGSVPAGLIFCGVMVSFCSLIGIWGARRRSRFLLLVYVGLFSLVVLIEFILAIVVLANRDSIPGWVTDTWNEASNTTKQYFQTLYGCCGLSDEFPIPPGGYEECPEENGVTVTDKCLPKMEADAQKSASAAGGVALVFALIEVIGIVLAQLLRNSQQAAQFADDSSSAPPPSGGASRRIR